MAEPSAVGLKISAVSRLSGVSPATIRIWERRYGAVTPDRTRGGGRQYTSREVERLRLLKLLVDRKYAISSIAALSEKELEKLLSGDETSSAARKKVCVAAIGSRLPARLSHIVGQFSSLEWVGGFETIAEAVDSGPSRRVDVAVLEMSSVRLSHLPPVLEAIRIIRPKLFIIVYSYGAERELDGVGDRSILFIKAPVKADQILKMASLLGARDDSPQVGLELESIRHREAPRPLFSESRLSELLDSRTNVQCECPRHFSQVVSSLVALERYSAECEVSGNDDSAIHRMLRNVAGYSRSLLEQALQSLLQYEAEKSAHHFSVRGADVVSNARSKRSVANSAPEQ